ncbi:MAG: nitrate reductase molybdenum cofactor assembly chaperone [Deltaproteobacteria bacterium]
MTRPAIQDQLLEAFADLLSYPATDPVPAARRCRTLVGDGDSARHLDRFVTRAEAALPHEMEEVYSATFDLEPTCAPYVGHHLCGEGPKRGVFMAKLADVYRQDGFEGGTIRGELPDHVAVVLRYLAAVQSGSSRQALLRDALVPALDKMLEAPLGQDNVYRSVLAALREEVA